jgi:hypothetical protein
MDRRDVPGRLDGADYPVAGVYLHPGGGRAWRRVEVRLLLPQNRGDTGTGGTMRRRRWHWPGCPVSGWPVLPRAVGLRPPGNRSQKRMPPRRPGSPPSLSLDRFAVALPPSLCQPVKTPRLPALRRVLPVGGDPLSHQHLVQCLKDAILTESGPFADAD